ncbi:hydrogenase accessory protein HypB [Leptolyngbya sp. 'hensonii']|uniref:hydrogenase nickel incorporation protein HypB n=1 Tax=Leptolyngbya sp. 'hensonii' TaxID=1922337 RepID=UPI0009501B02|nr:hydrogenase nickel incorporation protein HypB [Leptolyngbya sp. 'hensonii']OLP16887.1 hydrogenase accessory protein HypB [Leptolyngbya sp. 'hensonii']
MCVTCGCSDDAHVTIAHLQPETGEPASSAAATHTHVLADGTIVTHTHSHDPHPADRGSASEPAHLHAQIHRTTLTVEQNLLAKNDLIAAENRGWLKGRNTLALNLVSSPGSGKTTLLTRTIQDLQTEIPIAVIEGDQETLNDARRIQATGCPVVQINTGTGCHLEAAMVQRGLQELNPPLHAIVLIENVGNLVCPALFDLGEQAKVVILSVTEGEDKPIKYPHMFRASDVMVLTKTDLLPYVPFEVDRCLDYARQVNPQMQIFQVSAIAGTGLDAWYDWLRQTWQRLKTA